jgi:hypothetical protein
MPAALHKSKNKWLRSLMEDKVEGRLFVNFCVDVNYIYMCNLKL